MNDAVAKVTIRQAEVPAQGATPSQVMVQAANLVVEVFDVRRRSLKVKRLGALDRMRLFAAAGPDLAKNEQWIGMAAIAASVVEIDGDQVPKPNSRREMEVLVGRLEDDGLNAVAEAYQTHFGVTAGDDAKDAAKN